MKPDNNTTDDDATMFSKTSSFKEITMLHLTRITKLSSCELRGGYYSVFTTKSGEEKEYYVEDTREALENAIYCLAQLTISRFTKQMTTSFEKFETERENLKQTFLGKTKLTETEVLGESYYEDEDKILLEEYKIRKLNLYKNLFTELVIMLAAKNYLEVGEEMF